MKNYYENEIGYLELIKDTMLYGTAKTGRNGIVYSRFGIMIAFDNISTSFPLLTTKKMFWKGVVEELLWFLRGSTNSNELKEKGVRIWDGNSSREYLDSVGLTNYEVGELGPVYGFQWRNFNGDYPNNKNGVDQLKFVLNELQSNSRRAVLSAWNPCQIDKMALPPCHLLYNFYIDDNGLSCMLYMRSNDLFLGQPFNIASVSLLTLIIAKVLHIKAYKIAISVCDAHIYKEHLESVREQIRRIPNDLPNVEINIEPPPYNSSLDEKIEWIEKLKYENFIVKNYNSYDAIKAKMIS
jgi:thymidylate synthase